MSPRFNILIGLCALLLGLSACEPAPQNEKTKPETSAPSTPRSSIKLLNETLWESGDETIEAFIVGAGKLQTAVQALLEQPDADTLKRGQAAWQSAVLDYQALFFIQQLAFARPTLFSALADLDFLLAAHPIQPGYLDYYGDYRYSGLVHDIHITLDRTNLSKQHGLTDREDVVLGLYAIEYMLFGEQGKRPAADYMPVTTLSRTHLENGYKDISETPNNRRRQLLRLQAAMLLESSKTFLSQWQSLAAPWQQQTPEAQRAIVQQAFDRALTQLLLDLATINADAPQDAQRCSAAISSLEALYLWLPATRRDRIVSHLLEARAALQLVIDAGEPKAGLRRAYNALKQALELRTETANTDS